MEVKWIGSPNFTKDRAGFRPEAIVIHIMAGTLIGTDAHFQVKGSNPVSAHYGVGKNGEIHQYVSESNSAWHAGVINNPTWSLMKKGINPNHYTVGIEFEGQPGDVWTPEMKRAGADLILDISSRWGIPIDRQHVVGHYEIDAIRRPNCPAIKKGIIDELIVLAQNPQIGEAIAKLEEALKILKGLTIKQI